MTNIQFANQAIVQAVEQIIDGGLISVENVWDIWDKENGSSRMVVSSSMYDGKREIDEDEEETSVGAWLEAMIAVCEENDINFNTLAIDTMIRLINTSDYLLDQLEEDDVEKVSMKLTLEVDPELFSGVNLILTYSIYKLDEEGVMGESVIMDTYAYKV